MTDAEEFAEIRRMWDLDPDVAHLNHGSFGAPPRVVSAARARWQAAADANPMRYWLEQQPAGLAAARTRAEAFLGASTGSLALLPNVTAVISTLLAAIELRPGDEVIITNHGYGAVRIALQQAAADRGFRVTELALDVHADDASVVDVIAGGLTDSTRLVVVDHITSPTAREFPISRIVESLRTAGVPVLVDAAHAPGQVDVDVAALDADFWVGNLHKWAYAARGTAALVVAERHRHRVRPLVTSWVSGYPQAFDLTGTEDHSGWLALGDALDFGAGLGWDQLRERGPALAEYGQQILAAALAVPPDELWRDANVWMRCVPLPRSVAATREVTEALSRSIATQLRCEVAITQWSGRGYLRLSANAYNCAADYERLAAGLPALL